MNIRRQSLIAMLIIGTMIVSVMASEQPSGTPFDAIWNEINSIKSTIANLQDQINHIQLIPGPKGDKGVQGGPGPKGEPGQKGESGVSGYEIVKITHIFNSMTNAWADILVSCPTPKRILSGGVYPGFNEGGWSDFQEIYINAPTPTGDGWRFWARMYEHSPEIQRKVDIYAICANVQ